MLAFSNVKVAIISSIGFLLYFAYHLIDVSVGFKSFVGLSAGLFISSIFLQQITTGFYEESNYRVLEFAFWRTDICRQISERLEEISNALVELI